MQRKTLLKQIASAFQVHPVVALLGPRQCGKTTLARVYFSEQGEGANASVNYFDLEDPIQEERLKNPKSALDSLKGLVVIDEVQRAPEIFKYLRVLVDRPDNPAKFLILGSASRNLIRQSSESLAGRIQTLEITPFTLEETKWEHQKRHWWRGGFPRSYLAQTEDESRIWREAYIRTYLEQDIPNLGISIPPPKLRRFWMMLTHYHGQIFNASEIGSSLGLSGPTIKNYLDILCGTFMIRQLPPWFENIKKRQVKAPKIYFRDTGLFHRLLQLEKDEAILNHPKLGASWEGYVLEYLIQKQAPDGDGCYFWGVHSQAELDLLIVKDGKKIGYEIKYIDTPTLTKSIEKSMTLLGLNKLNVVYPGEQRFDLSDGVTAEPFTSS